MLDSSEDFDDNHVESFCVQIVDNFRVVTKKRPNRSRLIVVLALIASPLVRSPMIGKFTLVIFPCKVCSIIIELFCNPSIKYLLMTIFNSKEKKINILQENERTSKLK